MSQPTKEVLNSQIEIKRLQVQDLENVIEKYSGDPAPDAASTVKTAREQLVSRKQELDSLTEQRNRLG